MKYKNIGHCDTCHGHECRLTDETKRIVDDRVPLDRETKPQTTQGIEGEIEEMIVHADSWQGVYVVEAPKLAREIAEYISKLLSQQAIELKQKHIASVRKLLDSLWMEKEDEQEYRFKNDKVDEVRRNMNQQLKGYNQAVKENNDKITALRSSEGGV